MNMISYDQYLASRSFLSRPVKDSMKIGPFTVFKKVEDAKRQCVNENLFVVSLTVDQHSETDLYPILHDGEVEKAFGYLVAYGKNNQECCIFEEFPA